MRRGSGFWRIVNENRAEFIENLLKAFEKDHPEFIEQLKERGLNEEEIRA